jgi:dephospho-CoA kinase
MIRILITGMSGTGKSTLTEALAVRGHYAVDLDSHEYSEYRDMGEGEEWVWREDRVQHLLDTEDAQAPSGALFVSGCARNMPQFYPRFDHIVLFAAPPDVLIERLNARTTNPYGKTAEQQAEVLHNQRTVEPLLRNRATLELDATAPVGDLLTALERLTAP